MQDDVAQQMVERLQPNTCQGQDEGEAARGTAVG